MRTLSEILGLEPSAKLASIEYHGHTFPGYNKPIDNKGGGKHKKVVLAKKGDKVKMIGFGHRDYEHNYSDKAKKNYLKRSAGIKNKSGELTKNDKLSANYWARRVLWPSGPATGAAKKTAHVAGVEQALAVLGLVTQKTAAPAWLGPVAKDIGSHGLLGAATGALVGGLNDPEDRLRGIGYGATAGGLTGMGIGTASAIARGLAGALPNQVSAYAAPLEAKVQSYEDALREGVDQINVHNAAVLREERLLNAMKSHVAQNPVKDMQIAEQRARIDQLRSDRAQLLNDHMDTTKELQRMQADLRNELYSRADLNAVMRPFTGLNAVAMGGTNALMSDEYAKKNNR